ncbi:MAG: DEAD/DEAH box helicase [Chitinophagia bacterium]|jgi:superfamily II DNA/RNA helicase|nr:DEAD/DEAH box helicase [Chitinophagia bacterium]
MKFETLGFSDLILESLGYMGFEEATPIQEQAIPHIFEGRDILASAQTGTGKTAAFMLPILDMISRDVPDSTTALIIVPTRELALQIDQEIQAFSYTTNISSIPLYGGGDGQDWETQKRALESGVHVVVATPGKLKSFIQNKYLDCGSIKYLILDEADRMLDIGFYDDIISIIENLPKKRQNLLFSATMPDKIIKLSKQVLSDPVQIKIAISKPNENILQASFLVYDTQKVELLRHLIKDKPKYSSIIIFSSTKKNVSRIVSALRSEGMSAQAISSDLAQKDREAMLNDFKARKVRILVATDVISRGIDIKEISLVINFDVPRDAEDYVHRIGRTARAEASGVAITLINPDDMRYFHQIEQLIGKDVIKLNVPKELGESPAWDVSRRKKSDSFNSRKKSVKSRNFKKHKKKKD